MTGVLPASFTSDELRAAARLDGGVAVPAFAPGWAPEELGVADAVCLRVLLARGLAEVAESGDGPRVVLTGAARYALGPLLHPYALVEAVREAVPGGCLVAAESADGVVVADQTLPRIWRLCPSAEPAGYALLAGITGWLDELDVAADAAGPRPLAELQPLVRARVAVRTVRCRGSRVRTAGAVSWLDAGPAGVWLVQPDEESATVLPTDPAAVRAAVADLLAGTDPRADTELRAGTELLKETR